MNKKDPLVSVVMPAYNAEKYISEAIESILNQTFRDFEFIIVDDGSADKTWEIIQEYAKKDKRIIPVKNEENLKICKTLNKGIDLSRGKYIARMDADDWSFETRIEKQVFFMEDNPNVVVCGGYIEVCNENLSPMYTRKYPLTDKSIRKKLFIYSPFAHPSVMFRTFPIKREEYIYDYNLHDAEDYDLYFRLGKRGKFANLKDVLIKYRVSDNSISHKKHVRQGLLTLYIRCKAVIKYGYKIPPYLLLFQPIELLIILLFPFSLKNKVFSLMRKYV